MTSSILRPLTPPLALRSSIASLIALSVEMPNVASEPVIDAKWPITIASFDGATAAEPVPLAVPVPPPPPPLSFLLPHAASPKPATTATASAARIT